MTKPLPFPVPLTEKHRPHAVSEFIGLQRTRRILEAFLARPYESAWLFVGPSGIGKTTMALAIAEELKAELHHIPSRQCDLETVDTVTRMCQYKSFNFKTGVSSDWHLVLVDEADGMTQAAQHSLFSKLDSTAAPPRTIWIFTANSTVALEGRFLSRCRVLDFKNDTLEGELEGYLEFVYRKEGGRFPVSFVDLSKSVSYNVRDALGKLEVELLLGANRQGLPTEELKVVEAHTHNCPKCHNTWKHQDPNCGLAFRSLCPSCGGAATVGTLRAQKAWVTIRKKILDEAKQKKKRRKRKDP